MCATFDANNRAQDITGVLLCDGVNFLQVLEGSRQVLEDLYERAVKDRRHLNVAKLLSAPVPRRIFASYGMRLLLNRPGQWVDPAQLSLLFDQHVVGSSEDRTHAILRAFTSGRWSERTSDRFSANRSAANPAIWSDLPRQVAYEDLQACFAFQPIVDPVSRRITAVEALLRGHAGESPQAVLEAYTGHARSLFDFHSKASAFALAKRLNISCPLSINLLPSSLLAVDDAARLLLAEAQAHGFGARDFIVEITEEEAISNPGEFLRATDALRAAGIAIAIDDFGAGFAGLSLLASFQPDRLKIDRTLIVGVDKEGPRQAILRAIVDCCVSLGIKLVCEGVETEAEMRWLMEHDIHDFQGFLFARPLKAGIPAVNWPTLGDEGAVTSSANQVQRADAPTNEQLDAVVTDPDRLRSLRDLGVLDAPCDATFDRLVRNAARLTRAPVAFLSMVDEARDFYLAASGFDEPLATSRQLEGRTFCHYALLSDGPLVLEDVTAQEVFRDVPSVQTLGVRAYIGVPLVLENGSVVGSFCAIDFVPRRWTDDDVLVLTEMAESAMREFKLRTRS